MKALSIKLLALTLVITSFVGCSEDIATEGIPSNEVEPEIEEIEAEAEDVTTDEVEEDISEESEVSEESEIEEDTADVEDEISTINEIIEEAIEEEVIEEEVIEEEVIEEEVIEEEVIEEEVVEEVVEDEVIEEEVIEEEVVEEEVVVEEVVEETPAPVVTTTATNVTPTTVPDAQVKASIYSMLIAQANSPSQKTVYGTAVPSSSYMYRNSLNSTEQQLYDQLYTGFIQAQTSVNYTSTLSFDEIYKVSQYVYYDHPELIWINLMGITAGNGVLTPTYNGLQSSVATYYDTMATILANAKDLPNDMEKIKYIQNYISYHTKFDVSYVMANDSQTSYSALVGKRTVCTGYAKAFQHCMQLLGIPTTSVNGSTSNGTHVWNLLQLGGDYYNVDVNWDDWSTDPNQYNYSYFMVTDAQLSASRASHVRDSMSAHLPQAYGTTYSYKNYFG